MFLTEFPPVNSAGMHRSIRFFRYLPDFGWNPWVITRNIAVATNNDPATLDEKKNQIHRVGTPFNVQRPPDERQPKPQSLVSEKKNKKVKWLRSKLRPISQLLTETPDKNRSWIKPAVRKANLLCSTNEFQCIFSSGPPHSTHLAAEECAKKFQIPWIADFRDPWARAPWKRENNPLGQKLLPFYETYVVKNATAVILNTEPARQDFAKAYPKYQHKFVAIPNGLDPELTSFVSTFRKNHSRNRDEIILCHPGNLYGRRDPTSVLKAIALLHQDGIKIRFQQIGSSSTELNPTRIAEEIGIKSAIECVDPLPHEAVLKKMHQADLLLVIQPDAPVMVPGKVYEMLAFDTPIVAVCDSEATSQIVEKAGGFVSPSRDVVEVAKAIRSAIGSINSSRLLELRETSRQIYCGKNLTKQLSDLMSSTVARHS